MYILPRGSRSSRQSGVRRFREEARCAAFFCPVQTAIAMRCGWQTALRY